MWLMVLAGVLIIFFCLYTLNAVSRWFRSGSLAIGLDWAQTTSILMGMQLNWPDSLHGLKQALSALMFNAEIFAPECSMKTNYWETWAVQLMIPFVVTVCFGGIYLGVWMRHKYLCPKQEEGKSSWSSNHASAVGNAFVNGYMMFLSVFHPFLTKNSLEIFRCREMADGKAYLDVEPSLMCYTDEWYANLPFAIAGFIVYGIGIPLLFFVVLYRGRDRIDSRQFKRKFGSIFIIYRKQCWYWEIWTKTKKLLVCLAMNVFPEETTYQAIVSLLILEVGIHLNMKKQPFRFPENNFVQKVASLNSLLILFSGLMFYSEKLDGWAADTLIHVCLIYSVITVVWLIRGFFVEFIAYYGKWFVETRPTMNDVLTSAAAECILGSRSSLTKTSHWARTEDLLDKYSKATSALNEKDERESQRCPDADKPTPISNARGLRQARSAMQHRSSIARAHLVHTGLCDDDLLPVVEPPN
jgi:hypothetical protein